MAGQRVEVPEGCTVLVVPDDWRQQLAEVASFGDAQSVARLVEGWGDQS